ncbi:MAG: DUF6800 family protein [Planctomycetota bacterium]
MGKDHRQSHLRRIRHRRQKVKRLKARLAVATSAEERQRLVAKIEAVTRQPFAPALK